VTPHPQNATLSPSDYPLNLLLDWHEEQPRGHWAIVVAASLAVHVVLFFLAVRLPSLVARKEMANTRRVIVHRTPLYLPRDVMTQKTRNAAPVSKKIELAQLLEDRPSQKAHAAAPAPSIKHFELPGQVARQRAEKSAPKILPDAPAVALNQAPQLPSGVPNGLPTAAPPPQAPTPGPFLNIGAEDPANPNGKLAPPKSLVQAAVNDLTRRTNGNQVVITDDSQTTLSPGTPGIDGQAGSRHAAVELQSDPQGADFKPYLTRILAIVRANWRQVIPESVRMGTLRGRTVMEFIINRDGSIPKLVVAESSGSEPLDRAAVAGLSMSNRLPPLPEDFKGMQIRLSFAFAYNMPAQ
jgi:TonB family protein